MLTSTTTNVARFGTLGARGLQLPTAAFARGAACPYSAFVASSLSKNSQCPATTAAANTSISRPALKTSSPSRRVSSPTASSSSSSSSQSRFTIITTRRHASTTASSQPNPSSSSPKKQKQQQQQQQEEPALDWNTFFRLRKTRRRIQLASSVLTTAAGAGTGATLLVNQDPEWLLGQIPMDPIFSLGLLTLACAGLGWLAGPSLGSALFHLLRRGVKRPMAAKEAEFFARIRKNRVDPTTSSVQNPVPDFYGEKISSVAGYRQWLKDQRAFNKKRTMV